MRRADKEITDRELIDEVIKEAQVCRLGLCDGNMPYIVPMSFGYNGNCLYFHSAQEGRKLDIIGKNNNVCFEFDIKNELVTGENPCNWSMRYYSVIGTGKALFIDDFDEKKKALNIIMQKYSGRADFNFPEGAINKIAVFKIEIEEISGKKSRY